jgi:cytochrome c oxidase subunit 3
MSEAHAEAPFNHELTPEERRAQALLGMWLFLSTEILLFGGIFMSTLVYSTMHPAGAHDAASHMKLWIGGINSVVLIVSSLLVSLAISAAYAGEKQLVVRFLAATAACGVLFIILKGYEYYLEYDEHLMPFLASRSFALPDPASALYFNIYFAATGLHALHLSIGVTLMLIIAGHTARGRGKLDALPVEIGGLYWHLIDLVWILLYPTLYLANR